MDSLYNNFVGTYRGQHFIHVLKPQFIAMGWLKNFNVVHLDIEDHCDPDNIAVDEIDCRNLSYSWSTPRLAAASVAEDLMIVMVIVVVYVSCSSVLVWWVKRAEF
jgi:hypothetical protein